LPTSDKTLTHFCVCSEYHSKEAPEKLINFIDERTPQAKEIRKVFDKFANPELNLEIENDNLEGTISISARRTNSDVVEKLRKLEMQELEDKEKKILHFLQAIVKKREKEIKKVSLYRAFFKLDIRPKYSAGKPVNLDEMQAFLSIDKIKSIIGTIENTFPKPLRINFCPVYEFSANKFKPVGGLALPTEIPMPEALKTKIGTSELISYGLRFKDSAIGIEYLDLELDEDKLVLEFRASYELANVVDMLVNSYKLSNEISEVLVVKVK
jgi:hypothetical protein